MLRTDRDGQTVGAGVRPACGTRSASPSTPAATCSPTTPTPSSTWARPGIGRRGSCSSPSGADYGWRGVTGKWPPYFPDHPDNALPTLDIGRGSPTAVTFGTGPQFPARVSRALFVLDWTYGRMLAVHLAAARRRLPRAGRDVPERPAAERDRPGGRPRRRDVPRHRRPKDAVGPVSHCLHGRCADARGRPLRRTSGPAEQHARRRASCASSWNITTSQPAALDVAWPYLDDRRSRSPPRRAHRRRASTGGTVARAGTAGEAGQRPH